MRWRAASHRPDVIPADHSGVLVGIDRQRLVKLATDSGCVLHVVPGLGGFVPAGAPLVRIEGTPTGLDRRAVTDALRSGLERTLDEDLAYGFRLLVDMAERSLSDSEFLDPTTAVQCIDRLHDGLRQLAGRVIPDGLLRDDDGAVRVTIPTLDWNAYVHLAFDEIRLAGATSPQISRRMRAALDDLLDVAPAARRPPLLRQLSLLEEAVHRVTATASRTSASRCAPTAKASVSPHLDTATSNHHPTRAASPAPPAADRTSKRVSAPRPSKRVLPDEAFSTVPHRRRSQRSCDERPKQSISERRCVTPPCAGADTRSPVSAAEYATEKYTQAMRAISGRCPRCRSPLGVYSLRCAGGLLRSHVAVRFAAERRM